MKISKNFNRSEFKCKCGDCDYDTVDVELVQVLQDLRDHFGKTVTITSGNRCPTYNVSVGGAPKSYHPRGRAADITVKDTKADDVYNYLIGLYPNEYGFGHYHSFVHIDTRSSMARW